jgi:BirA family biotin operon repressor/biotin-[acetyl-CoA-carboxylase] ligase
MNQKELKKSLSELRLGNIRYFDSIGSTNDEALAWAATDAKDLSLVVADEQTAGRGRLDRKWFTPPEAALAFSLILRPAPDEQQYLTRIVGLAALSVAQSLQKRGISPQIKWPNDILLKGQKVAGILVESVWSGDQVDCVVIGIGINVRKEAVPEAETLQFPATSLEEAVGQPVERLDVLHDTLEALITLRPQLGTDEFIRTWEEFLAFRGEPVQIDAGSEAPVTGKLLGLETDGSLRLMDQDGKPRTVQFGDVRLRPLT